jgi:hypothetical protein
LLYGARPIFFGRSFWAAPVLPEFIRECRDVLLSSIVTDPVGAVLGGGLLMVLLWVQVSLVGVLKELSGALVAGQMIFCSVAFGPGAMGVSSQVMMLSSYLL